MTPKQRQFVAEYALSRNATNAAVKAGYSPRTARQTGSENLTKPDIRAAVTEHEAAAAERLGVSRERVLYELEAAVDLARAQGDPGAMIAGLREVAKLCGFYAPNPAVKLHVNVAMKRLITELETRSDAELLAVAAQNGDLASPVCGRE